MKRIFALLAVLMFSFGMVGANRVYAEEIPAEEPQTQEEIDLEEVRDEINALVNEALEKVWVWIGSVGGVTGLIVLVWKYLKDRGFINALKAEMANSTTTNQTMTEQLAIQVKREEALEKGIIALISLSNATPEVKEKIIEGLRNDTITLGNVVEAGLKMATTEATERGIKVNQIQEKTQSLLEKIANKG